MTVGGGEWEEVRAGGDEQIAQGLAGHRKDLGLYPERGGTPGGLGTKQRCALKQMFTGAPWLLWQRTDWGLEGASQGPGEEEDPLHGQG